MKTYKFLKSSLLMVSFIFLAASCDSELDKTPITEASASSVFNNPEAFRQFLAKIYTGISLSGQQGPFGDPDIAGIDEGFSNYLRQYWMHEELTTEEAELSWQDGTVHDLNDHLWNSSNEFVRAMYDRIYFQISLSNQFLRDATEDRATAVGLSTADVRAFRAEARFMRALSYWHAMDMYGNIPFVTEEDPVGSFFPEQKDRAFIFDFLVTELTEIQNELVPARQNQYGRADQAAAQMLLAKIFLNAEVYIGQPRYTEAITELNKIFSAGYSLHDNYEELFLADNNTNGAQNEVIFPIPFDGLNTQGFGGTTFIIKAPVGGRMDPVAFGISGGWAGVRTSKQFVANFSDITGTTDQRAMFFTDGQTLEVTSKFNFSSGYAIGKFKNVTSAGVPGSDASGEFMDTDFPMFRLADAYLMFVEAVLRGGSGGNISTALDFVNQIRTRAYGDQSGNISSGELTLDFILAERARELHFEAHRRTDLVRFDRFTQNSIWPWKGGTFEGAPSQPFRNLYPIPSTDMIANPNLVQNPGY